MYSDQRKVRKVDMLVRKEGALLQGHCIGGKRGKAGTNRTMSMRYPCWTSW